MQDVRPLPLLAAALALAACDGALSPPTPSRSGRATSTSAARVVASAAPVAPKAPSDPPAAAPTERRERFGEPVTSTNAVTLAEIATHVGRYANKTVRTEGKVTAVCQSAGCWMEVADSASEAHVRLGGHKFFVPKNAAGRRAVVQGTVLAKPNDGECEQEAAEATGKAVKLELDATGVELL